MSSRHPFFGQFLSAHRPPPALFFVVFFLLPSPLLPLSSRTSVERSQLLSRRHTAISSLAGRKELRPSPPPQSVPINPTAQPSNSSSNSPSNSLEEEQNIIQRLLHSENNAAKELYDWRVRPRGTMAALRGNHWSGDFDMPVMVDVNMYLRSISKVDDVNMEFTMHFTFRQEWTDERLFFHSHSLAYIVLISSEYSQRIFLPDTFFQNEKDGKKHDVDKPNVFIRVYNGTGRVLYSSRMTLTLSCPMHLQAYPLDTQTCFIDYASYAYTTKDLEYRWKADDPIQIKHGMRQSLPSFVLSAVTTANCTSVTNTGTYSCLRTIIRLRREFSYYLLQLYVPSFMLVAVSTVSFWLDKDSVPARITLGTTVLLTVTTMASGINAKLPPVSYTKSVDIWIGVCTGFIFGLICLICCAPNDICPLCVSRSFGILSGQLGRSEGSVVNGQKQPEEDQPAPISHSPPSGTPAAAFSDGRGRLRHSSTVPLGIRLQHIQGGRHHESTSTPIRAERLVV